MLIHYISANKSAAARENPPRTRPENMLIDGKRSRIPRRAFQTAQSPPEMSDA
ncbi:hypothetical protein [Neisseria meningitidis]|uniref:hypothetical protein n=1 Tax=Neisseria meningitidis TaxID=487 RepID=UPI000AC05D1C